MTEVFTQRHYEWLADWLVKYRKSVTDDNADYVAESLATAIGAQHPKFKRGIFLERARGGGLDD